MKWKREDLVDLEPLISMKKRMLERTEREKDLSQKEDPRRREKSMTDQDL